MSGAAIDRDGRDGAVEMLQARQVEGEEKTRRDGGCAHRARQDNVPD